MHFCRVCYSINTRLCKPHHPCMTRFFKPVETSTQKMFFPTCQVRVVRLYVSCRPPPHPPRPLPPAPPPAPHSVRVGPQPRGPAGSVPRRTSTASSVLRRTSTASFGCSPPDLNRQLRMAVCPAGPQPRASDADVLLHWHGASPCAVGFHRARIHPDTP